MIQPVKVISLLARTPGKIFVSILIPTRTRPESRICEVVDNCIKNSSDPGCLEFCIKVDSDDHQALLISQSLERTYPFSHFVIHITNRGQGYLDEPRYINELAARSKGDWLWLLSDNAWPITKNWDIALESWYPSSATYLGAQDVCLYSPFPTDEEGFMVPISPYPLVRRKMYEILGHLTLWPGWDSWLNSVMWMMGSLVTVKIRLEHVPTKFRTKFEDEIRNRVGGRRFSTEMRRAMIADATKLTDYLEDLERRAKWLPNPNLDGFHFWRSPHGFILLILTRGGQVFCNEEQKPHITSGGQWLPVGSHGELLE